MSAMVMDLCITFTVGGTRDDQPLGLGLANALRIAKLE
jgi:hypothetical protein